MGLGAVFLTDPGWYRRHVDPKSLEGAARALSKPLVKLVEVVASGCGAVSAPALRIINAHAEGRAALVREGYAHRLGLLRAKHLEEIAQLSGGKAGALPCADDGLEIEVIFEAHEPSDLAAAHSMATEQEAKRYANVMTIAAEAADRMGDDVSDDPVDADWVARFFGAAQDVSNRQLQELWGSLLAGEVSRPGSVPLRTLEILKNLTADEAMSLQQLAARTTSGVYFPYGEYQIDARRMHLLRDAGILDESESAIRWTSTEPPPERSPGRPPQMPPGGSATLHFPSGHQVLIEAKSTVFQVSFFRIRPSALPLVELAYSETDEDYLKGLVADLDSQDYFEASLLGQGTSQAVHDAAAPEESEEPGSPS